MGAPRPRICLCGSFLSNLYPRRVYFSHRIFGFQHSLFCQSRGNIASPSHVNHLSCLIKAERLMQTAESLMPGAFLSHTIPFLSTHKSPNSYRITLWMQPLELTPFHVCSAALPVAWRRALTQKADSRTRRAATWPIPWSGLWRASLTKFARRAALPRSTSRACTAWSQVGTCSFTLCCCPNSNGFVVTVVCACGCVSILSSGQQ